MAAVVTRAEKKNLHYPDEVRTFPKGRAEIVNVGGHTLMRATFEPGWRWSAHMKPLVGTDLCEVRHLGLMLSGRMHLKMTDGAELLLEPEDFIEIPPGHDAWVVGDDPVVFLDFVGGETYARAAR